MKLEEKGFPPRSEGTKQKSEKKGTHDLELHDLAVELDGPDFLRGRGVWRERENGESAEGRERCVREKR